MTISVERFSWTQRLRSLRAWVDYQIREKLTFENPVRSLGNRAESIEGLQRELDEFLSGVPHSVFNGFEKRGALEVLDVGAKDFVAGPVIERFLSRHQLPAHVHGIEIDAHRRMRNLRSRADYASYFLGTMQNGTFHAMDFLQWRGKADVIVMLNPFVIPEPLLRWGLPLRHFRPAAIFAHCRRVLGSDGVLITCAPTEHEREAIVDLASWGFYLAHEWDWSPRKDGVQTRPRLGAVWKSI